MKIQCQSCQAKYTIADEKVLGKIVKIRCKKCSSTIVINGHEQSAALAQGGDGQAFDYAAQGADQWTVNVADGDQRTLTVAEIAAEYRSGVIHDETYCWKDGMPDWLPLREIEELSSAVSGGAAASPPEEMVGVSIPPPQSLDAAHFGGGASEFPPPASHASDNGAFYDDGGATAIQQVPAPAAARRAGGRAQGADLFGNVEKAGGEDDVMTSAATAASASPGFGAASADDKLTGQRNENSVLFSLAALTQDKPAENRTTATADGSGLIDIRALSASMDDSERKTNEAGARVDDIMNLSGGGAFGAALAAPILAPAPLEAVDMAALGTAADAPGKQNKTLIAAILGGFAFLGLCGVAAAMLMRAPSDEVAKADPTLTATTEAAPMAAAPAAGDPTTTPPAEADDDGPAPPGTGQSAAAAAPAQAKAPTAKAAAGGAAKPAPAAPAPAPAPKPAAKPKDLSGALAEAAGKKPDPAPSRASASTASFDRGAAAAALGGVNVQSCKKAGGPTGPGRVTVTFGPDGSAQSAVVDPPYQGTAVGGCVAGKFRGARVPAFGGAPVRVGKSFIIN